MSFSNSFWLFLFIKLVTFSYSQHVCSDRHLISINPPDLINPTPNGYSHITVDKENSIAHIAGQVAVNRTAHIIGDNLAEQLIQVERNLNTALEAVGAQVEDILKMNTYMVNFKPQTDIQIYAQSGKRFGNPAGTIVSVLALAIDGLLVETELVVALKSSLNEFTNFVNDLKYNFNCRY